MTRHLTVVPVLLLVTCLHMVTAVFSPNVTIKSCTSNSVVVRVKNAADGGIIYIQGSGPDCSRTTVSQTSDYTFSFDTCGLQYDQKFRVIIQQRPNWQTGFDKVIPVMCFLDTSDLVVTGVIYPEESSDKSVNKTVKPTVLMGIQTAGSDENLSEVTLNDNVRMVLRLDDEFMTDFDIKAKDCTAALIPVLRDECSADEQLFPNFNKSSQGILTTDFQAFQPTSLGDDPEVDVSFTCNVAVCKGQCERTICGEIVGWGRKKRGDEKDNIVERVTCGTTIRVKSPLLEGAKSMKQSEFCAGKVIVTSVTTVTAITLIFSWLVCGCILSKLVRLEKQQPGPKKPSTLRRLSEKNINFARSVGRRLSTMLNLPIGYDMRDPKMMDCIPEMYPTPPMKRRESVTVSTSSTNEHTDNDDVSISTSCTCVLRRRLVSSASQTDTGSEYEETRHNSNECVRSQSPVSQFRSNNPITSLSIMSYSRSGSLDTNDIFNGNQSSNTNNKTLNGSDGIDDETDTVTRDYVTADEIPRNRETRFKRSANFNFTPDADIERDVDRSTSNVSIITVGRPQMPVSNHDVINQGLVTEQRATNDNVYTTIGNVQNELDASSGKVGGHMPPRFEPETSREHDSHTGTSSILNSFISSSRKTIGRVADAITTLPHKNKFDLPVEDMSTSAEEVNTFTAARSISRSNDANRVYINEKKSDSLITTVSHQANDQSQDENFYEPIYFGDKPKTERKLSTHV